SARRNSVPHDSCGPDPYANSNFADNFAQVVVLWIHLVAEGLHPTLGGSQFSCMKNQIQQISKALPAYRIQAPRSSLPAGQQLQQWEALTSSNGAYRLIMQEDGNLVLYVSEKCIPVNAIWSTGSFSNGPHRFQIQTNGNLVAYNGKNQAMWNSNSSRQNVERGHLVMQNDGNLVLHDNNHRAVWASNTCCFIAPRA
ncbi:unnamed protein product, partial [Adineta ricciae]